MYWKPGTSEDGILVFWPLPARPPLICQKTLRPSASFVVILAHLVLVRLHLGQDVENVGQHLLHGPQFRFGDGETGEQGGLQTYTPSSSSGRRSSAANGTRRPASPFRLANEMTGTGLSSAKSAGDDDGKKLPYGKRRREPSSVQEVGHDTLRAPSPVSALQH